MSSSTKSKPSSKETSIPEKKVQPKPSQPRQPVVPKKIVIRRLPPDMVSSTFMNQVSPIPPHDYMYFVKADIDYGQHAYARAYINFIHEKDMYLFKEKYDGYVFLNAKGIEYPAVVEFAPFPRIPRKAHRRYNDQKAGTIEENAYFQSFVKKAQCASPKPVAKDVTEIPMHVLMNTAKQNEETSTPLLSYISKKRTDKPKVYEEKWKSQHKKKDHYTTYICFNSNSRYSKRNY